MQIQLDDLCISGVSLPLVRNTELDLGYLTLTYAHLL